VQAEANKFWIVVPVSDSSAEIKSLLKALKKEIVVNKIPLYLEYSIGYAANKALYECANLDAFISSDLSARIAKETNQSFLIYDESVQKKQLDVDLLGHFAKALEEGNTHLVFQPIINLSSNQVNGFESLIRWKHHLYGLIPPSTFIPLAEDTELIHTMTSCVIRESISLIQTLQSININLPVSINVSIRNLYHPHFIEELDKSLQVAGLEVGQLELEIAERNLYANKAKSLQILEELSRRHYVVAIDDFGDSKSMMSFSSGFVAQTLKIDQCFIRDVATNERIKQLLSQTVTLAHDYGYKVLAEGVEDENTHKICKELGFDDAQGYFYALPMNKEDLLYYLKNHLPKKQVEVVE
ncbi:MAG: EAL domain-containing protein, partial [Candidatus Izemoplasmatales bacterium]|nr:EAL domain-containing protein [Candidatus Izemoplasmatales bacterium]